MLFPTYTIYSHLLVMCVKNSEDFTFPSLFVASSFVVASAARLLGVGKDGVLVLLMSRVRYWGFAREGGSAGEEGTWFVSFVSFLCSIWA